MTSFADVIKGMDWSYPVELLISSISALCCIVLHEYSHGLTAYALGDETAKKQGRLSLNPLHHIDLIGLVMLAVFRFGWAKPVSVDMRNFKHPKRDMALTALAGPVSNFVFALLLLLIRGLLTRALLASAVGQMALRLLDTTAYLSVCLGLFNLIPIPPLDGSKVLFALLPDRLYMKLMRYEKYGMLIMLMLVVSGIVSGPLHTASYFVFDKLFEIARAVMG